METSSKQRMPSLPELRRQIAERRRRALQDAAELETRDAATDEGLIAHEKARKLRRLAWDLQVLASMPDDCLRVQLENLAEFHSTPVLEGGD